MYANYKILPSFIHWFLTTQCPQSAVLSGTGGFQTWGFPGVVHWFLTPHCWDSIWPVTESIACLLDKINEILQTRTLHKIKPEGQTNVPSLQKLTHNFQNWSPGFIFPPKNNPKPDTEGVVSINWRGNSWIIVLVQMKTFAVCVTEQFHSSASQTLQQPTDIVFQVWSTWPLQLRPAPSS